MYPQNDTETTPTGLGIGIAFLDTGISPVADFTQPQNRVIAFRDFIDGKKHPYDNNGHGTQVTGAPTQNSYHVTVGADPCVRPPTTVIAISPPLFSPTFRDMMNGRIHF